MQYFIHEYGSEYDLDSNNKFISFITDQSFSADAEFFRSGRDALKAIANRYKGLFKRIMLPALCCESMVSPFQMHGYSVLYYKLNSNLTANINDILSKLENSDVLMYMNYFGIQSMTDEELKITRDLFPNLLFIEDKTHDILSNQCNEFVPDFSICSIRKWLGIPDGGILYSKKDREIFFKKQNTLFYNKRIEAFKNKSLYLKYGDIEIKELFRNQLSEANECLENDDAVVGISNYSYELLKSMDFGKIKAARLKNINILSSKIINTKKIKQLDSFSIDKVSLYYPVIVNDRNLMQNVLAKNGVYCPVIWPLPEQAGRVCSVADEISEKMLAVPCDQRYSISDMGYIANVINRVFGE